MKSEVKETKEAVIRKYPYIGKYQDTGLVILFTAPEKGVVISGDKNYSIGHYGASWLEREAKIFSGTVTLSND